MKNILFTLVVAIMLTSCVSTKLTRGQQYAKMYEEKPLTLLVMPPINNTSNVEAKDLLYTSISKPLIDAGYYVIPPFLAMDVLKAESAYDSEMFIESSLMPFRNYFGADAVIFSIVESWAKKGFGINTKIRYMIKSAYTNEVLFDKSCDLHLDLSSINSGGSALGALVSLVTSVINTAVTDHIVAARKANNYIFWDIPRGKHHQSYLQDMDETATQSELRAVVK